MRHQLKQIRFHVESPLAVYRSNKQTHVKKREKVGDLSKCVSIFLNFSGLLSTHTSIICWFLCLEDLQDKAVCQAVSGGTRAEN